MHTADTEVLDAMRRLGAVDLHVKDIIADIAAHRHLRVRRGWWQRLRCALAEGRIIGEIYPILLRLESEGTVQSRFREGAYPRARLYTYARGRSPRIP